VDFTKSAATAEVPALVPSNHWEFICWIWKKIFIQQKKWKNSELVCRFEKTFLP
jgi:hypothetical protein